MHTPIRFITAILALATLGWSSQAPGAEFLSEYTASGDEPYGKLIGDTGFVTQDIYPVYFTRINGSPVTSKRDVLRLKPGTYEVRAAILATPLMRTVPGGSRQNARDQSVEPIEVVIEEGKQYYIGGHHLYDQEGSRRQAWTLMLWKVVDADGETEFRLAPTEDEENPSESPSDDNDDNEAAGSAD